MPVYVYICKDCGAKFDLLVGVTLEKVELKCKKCASRNIEKTIGTFNVGSARDKVSTSAPACPPGPCRPGACPAQTCPVNF